MSGFVRFCQVPGGDPDYDSRVVYDLTHLYLLSYGQHQFGRHANHHDKIALSLYSACPYDELTCPDGATSWREFFYTHKKGDRTCYGWLKERAKRQTKPAGIGRVMAG